LKGLRITSVERIEFLKIFALINTYFFGKLFSVIFFSMIVISHEKRLIYLELLKMKMSGFAVFFDHDPSFACTLI